MAEKREGPFYTHIEALDYAEGINKTGGKAHTEYDRHWWVVVEKKPAGSRSKGLEPEED